MKVCWELKKRIKLGLPVRTDIEKDMGPVTWKQELSGRTMDLGGRLCTEESLRPLYRVETADL